MSSLPDTGRLPQMLADEFTQRVRDFLPPEQMQEIVKRNLSNNPSVCATHDFCDANELMAQAFVQVMGRESNPSSSVDAELWGAAWALAKNAGFARPLRLFVWQLLGNAAFAYVIRRKAIFNPRRDHRTQSSVDPATFYRIRPDEVAALDRANQFLRLTRAH